MLKPDVVAEGANVFTAWLFDTNGDGLNDLADLAIVGGTSFSAPTTAGGVALLTKFAHVNGFSLSGQPIKGALLYSARPLIDMNWHQQGYGFIDLEAARDYWLANPSVIAGKLNKQKRKFQGNKFAWYDFGSIAYGIGSHEPLNPGQQNDFLLPMETSSADQPYVQYIYLAGTNKQRIKPFPGVVQEAFDPDPDDGVPPFAALRQNTEIYYSDGINTGFSDGDYIFSTLNMVDTAVYSTPNNPLGILLWYPTDPFGAPVTGPPSGYAQVNSHQQMGSNGFADFDRLTFLGDVTNEPTGATETFFFYVQDRRSDFGLTTGTPSMTGTISQDQVQEFDVALPAPFDFYQFHNSFNDGWNNYKFAPKWTFEPPYKQKRKVADLDFLVESPSGVLINESLSPLGIGFQGASLNDVEMVHALLGPFEAGNYHVTVLGFDVKGVPKNHENWALRIWDGFVPIIP
jgi:hypothetical protein